MKRILILSAATMAAVFLTGCPTGAHVQTDYDHSANFSQFKTFSFAHVTTENPLYEQRIKDEVTKDLQAKGLQMQESGGDLMVTAVGATKNRQEYQTFYNGTGFGYYYGGFGSGGMQTTRVIHYKVGTLVLDMYNGQNKQLVWRGTATRGVADNPDAGTEHLNAAIDKLLSGFPPK